MRHNILKWLDIPPVWLAGAIALAFVLDRLLPGFGFGWGWSQWLGRLLVVLGLLAMALAVWEFQRARTTFVPRRIPTAFLSTGIYRFTRNPIYLGDALILAGLTLHWDVLIALPLVPGFMALITWRFIRGEEAGLAATFGEDFKDWSRRVRRWL